METDKADFVDALLAFVKEELQRSGEPADYNVEALRVVDARNHIFRPAGKLPTDEADDIYALRDLCRVDEETMEMVPDRGRIAAVARNYF